MNNEVLNRVNQIKSMLLSKNTIKVKNNWITECVNFCCEDNPQISDDDLMDFVFEQFILSDAKDSFNPVIPATINKKKEPFTLNGTFVLQLQYLLDVSESPYEQWRRLHNIELDDVKDNRENKTFQSKKKRMFKLELTDGFQTINAMEYSTISCLNTKISPGCKVKIIGPLQVVNHVLFLETKNIEILGGDVETLAIKNAYENVLLRELKKPETENPIRDYKEPAAVQESSFKQDTAYQRALPAPPPQMNTRNEVDEVLNGINFDDDDIDMEDLQQISEVENRFRMSQEQQQEVLEILDEIIEIPDNQPTTSRLAQQSPQVVAEIDLSGINDFGDYVITRRINSPPKKILKLNSSPKKKQVTIVDDEYEFKTTCKLNLVTINQYLSMRPSDRTIQDYAIFGTVSEFQTNKLKVLDNKWNVEVELSDEYSNNVLSALISNDIIEQLTQHTAEDMKKLYEQARSRPQIKGEIVEMINDLYEKLVNDDHFFRIHFQPNLSQRQSIVQVTEFIETNLQENLQTFHRKIQQEQLKKIINPSDEES